MRRGRSSQGPLIDSFPEPERVFHQNQRDARRMGDNPPNQNQAMAELQRQLELAQAQLAEEREAREELQARQDALPKTAADYLKPAVKMAVSPLV